MRYLLIIVAVLVLPLSAFAQAVYSANGFMCSKDNNTVLCDGQFPGVKGTFGAAGSYSVIVKYELDGRDYQYDSHQGCLLVGDQKKQELRMTNRKGKSKTFKSLRKAMAFCEI